MRLPVYLLLMAIISTLYMHLDVVLFIIILHVSQTTKGFSAHCSVGAPLWSCFMTTFVLPLYTDALLIKLTPWTLVSFWQIGNLTAVYVSHNVEKGIKFLIDMI